MQYLRIINRFSAIIFDYKLIAVSLSNTTVTLYTWCI